MRADRLAVRCGPPGAPCYRAPAQALWRRPSLPPHEAYAGLIQVALDELRHHPAEAQYAAGRTRRIHQRGGALALRPRITREKTTHAQEQDVVDILKTQQAWFNGQLDLDPERFI